MSKKLLAAVFAAAFLATGGMSGVAYAVNDGTMTAPTAGTPGDTGGDVALSPPGTTVTIAGTKAITGTSGNPAIYTINAGHTLIGVGASSDVLTIKGNDATNTGSLLFEDATGINKLDIGADASVTVSEYGVLSTAGTNSTSLIENTGTLAVGGTTGKLATLNLTNGSLTNKVGGSISIGEFSTLTGLTGTGAGTINNAATIGGYDKTTAAAVGFHIDAAVGSANVNNLVANMVTNGTEKGIGDVVLTGTNTAAITLTNGTDGAASGNLYLGGASTFTIGGTGTDNAVDAKGANLIIADVTSSNNFNGAFSGKNVDVNQGATINGTINAWGTGTDAASANGIVTLDNASIDLQGTVNAGLLNVEATATFSDNASTNYFKYSGDLKVADGVTLTNAAMGFTDGVANFDLSGKSITTDALGTGTIDNTAGLIAMKGATTIGDGININNTGAGVIQTDATALKGAFSKADGTFRQGLFTGTADNVGILSVSGTVDVDGINWSGANGAKGGNIRLDNLPTGTGATTFGKDGGTVNLGDAGIVMNNSTGNTLKGTIKAGVLSVLQDGTNDSDFTGDVNIAGGKTLTNAAPNGKITIDAGDTLTVAGTLVNENSAEGKGIVITENAIIASAAGGNIQNFADDGVTVTESLITVDGRNTDLDDLAVLLNDAVDNLDSNGDVNIGTVDIVGGLTQDFEPDNATAGTVSVKVDNLTSNNTIDIGGADLIFDGDGIVYGGAATAGTVVIEGDGGNFSGANFTLAGDYIVDGENNRVGTLNLTGGDFIVEEDALGTILTGPITANAAGGPPAEGGNITLNESVTALGGATLTAVDGNVTIKKGGTFGGAVTATRGNVIINGGGIYNAAVTATSVAPDTVNGNVTINKGTYNAGINASNNIELTDAVTNNVAVVADRGNITLKGQNGVYSSGFTTTNPTATTTLDTGARAVVVGALDTDFVVGNRATWEVSGGDATLAAGATVATGAGSTIYFDTLDGTNQTMLSQIRGGTGADIDLSATTGLSVNRDNVDDGDEFAIFDAAAYDLIEANMGTDGLKSYLKDQNVISLTGDREFWTGEELGRGDGIYFTNTAATDIDAQLDKVFDAHGIGEYRGMVSETSLASQLAYDAMTTAEFSQLTGDELYIASLMKSAAGDWQTGGYDLRNNPNAAYALEQWKSGADWAGAVEAVTDTVRNFNRAITNRAYNIGHLLNAVEYDECGNVINSCGGFKNRIWAGYTGQWAKNNGRDWDKGYKYDANGFNIGYDHVTSSGVGFGAAFGYSKGDYKNQGQLFGDKSKIDNYSFGLFASYNHQSGFFTTLSGTYTYSKYKMHNGFAGAFGNDYGNFGARTDRADFHGDSWSVGGKIGYDINPISNLTITPTLGVYYYTTRTNNFDSTYRTGMKYKRHTVEMPLDVTMKYDIAVGCDSTLSLMATAGYAYNFHNKGTEINRFAIDGSDFGDYNMPKPGRSSWNVGGGAQFRYKAFDVGVHYEYYGRRSYKSHNLTANVGMSF